MKGIVYYTDNYPDPFLLEACRNNLQRCVNGFDIVSVSQKPVTFGRNIVMEDLDRSPLSIFVQILCGIENSIADVIFLCEHDIIYHPSHFIFDLPRDDVFYYNRNRWAVDPDTGKAVFYQTNCISMLCASRELLLKHFARRVELTEMHGFQRRLGYSPPKGLPKEERGRYKAWFSEWPCLDIRHNQTFTKKRMSKDQFRSPRSCRDWQETYDVPFWGPITPWSEFLENVNDGQIVNNQ
jgi:hypothetical protein